MEENGNFEIQKEKSTKNFEKFFVEKFSLLKINYFATFSLTNRNIR